MFRLACSLLFFAILTDAHLPYFETERLRQNNFDCTSWACWKPTEDFSAAAPFDILAEINAGLFPGETRNPTSSLFVTSRLNGENDVDYFLFNKTDSNETSLLGYTILHECDSYKNVFLTTALMGPLDTVDGNGILVFSPPTGGEPFEVPKGYGVLTNKPITVGKRPRFCTPETGNCWYLPVGYDEFCVENYSDEVCATNPGVITVQGVTQPGKYIFVVYNPRTKTQEVMCPGWQTMMCPWWRHRRCRKSRFVDYAFVTGTEDNFVPSDFARLSYIQQFISSGRLVAFQCEVPF